MRAGICAPPAAGASSAKLGCESSAKTACDLGGQSAQKGYPTSISRRKKPEMHFCRLRRVMNTTRSESGLARFWRLRRTVNIRAVLNGHRHRQADYYTLTPHASSLSLLPPSCAKRRTEKNKRGRRMPLCGALARICCTCCTTDKSNRHERFTV
jgi:hypothetical protein